MLLTRGERLLAAAAALCLVAGVAAAASATPPAAETARLLDAPVASPSATASALPSAVPTHAPRSAVSATGLVPRQPAAAIPAAALPYPLPAPPAQPEPCPVPPGPGYTPPVLPPPAVSDAALPAPLPLLPHHADLAPISGKGIWLTTFADTVIDVPEVIRRATAANLRQLWVRTGGYKQGYYGDGILARLLPAAHRAGIAVVAWDFPSLSDPDVDAARVKRALDFTVAGQRIDAISPDIETSGEGVYLSAPRVARYLSLVRRYAGDRPVVATVFRPSDGQLRTYPYQAQVPYVDAFAPMVYWSCHEPGALVAQSIARLAKLRPVHAIGQSYDMGPDGGRPGMPTGAEIWRFLDSAKRAGAVGASLYLYRDTKAPQWRSLTAYPWPQTP